jgi:hypothetical protein
MADTCKVYAHASQDAFGGTGAGTAPNIDWLSDTIYIALCTASYTPNQGTDEFWSTPVANEVANGNGYTTNGALLASKTLASAALVTTFNAASPAAWVASGAGFTAAYAVIYDRTPATDATRPLICYITFASTKTLAAGDTLTITFNGSGIFTVTVA